MNPRQRWVLVAGLLVLALMFLFPPWRGGGEELLGGCGPIWNPPHGEVRSYSTGYAAKEVVRKWRAHSLNWERLFMQGAFVVLVTGAVFLWAGKSHS